MQNCLDKNYQTNVNFFSQHQNKEIDRHQVQLSKPNSNILAASGNLIKRTNRYTDDGPFPPQSMNDSGIQSKIQDK